MNKNNYYIKKTIQLAKRSAGRVSPNPMVGCIVVKNDRILSKGYHRYYGGPHAEVEALSKLKPGECLGATLFISLEPCNHQGKTPPCTKLIAKYPFKEIVIGTKDTNPLVNGKGIRFLRNKGFKVTVGIEKEASTDLNKTYFNFIKNKMPFITLKAAISLDGKIATSTGDSKWITSKNSRKDAHRLRYFNDAVMVGVNTVITDNPRLDCRLYKKDKTPAKIIIDPNGRIPEDSYILKTTSENKTYVAVKKSLTKKSKHKLVSYGIDLIELDDKEGVFDLSNLMHVLAEKGITSILIEGGGKLLGTALKQGIGDKIYLYMAPIALGSTGINVFNTNGINLISEGKKFEIDKIKKFGPDIRITAHICQDEG